MTIPMEGFMAIVMAVMFFVTISPFLRATERINPYPLRAVIVMTGELLMAGLTITIVGLFWGIWIWG